MERTEEDIVFCGRDCGPAGGSEAFVGCGSRRVDCCMVT